MYTISKFKMMNTIYLFIVVIALFVLLVVIWYIITSNNLIAKRNRMAQCQSSICVMLKQRNSLIPNLVATVKIYMGHENQTLTRIAELRAQATVASSEAEQIKAGNELSALLPRLQLSVENYPDLKANGQFINLQHAIEEMEMQLQAIRRTYNAAVVDYNNYIEMFPSSWVATRKKHALGLLIEIPESEAADINVNNLFNN